MSLLSVGGLLLVILGVVLLLCMYWTDAHIAFCVLPLAVVFLGSIILTKTVIDAIQLKAVEEANSATEVTYQEIVIDNKRYVLAEDIIVIDGEVYILAEDTNTTETTIEVE